jgi:hypothetical protein
LNKDVAHVNKELKYVSFKNETFTSIDFMI